MGSNALGDIGAAINSACEELSMTKNWRQIRKVVRLLIEGDYFTLPQECETVIRSCVDGKPVTMHGTDIEFMLSGPGDFDYTEIGQAPVNGLQDLGSVPVMYTPPAANKLYFFSTSVPGGEVTVKGRIASGEIVTEIVPVNSWASATDLDTNLASAYTGTTNEFEDIERVVLPDDAQAYISCYSDHSGVWRFLSRMHPSVKVPAFRRYRIPGFDTTTGTSYQVLAEVRIRYLPLVDDEDVLPFDSLLPVQYMLQSLWKMAAEDIKAADEYRMRAEGLLVRSEEVKEERGGVVVVNSVYDGSPGEACASFDNI
jgi:hypothetical protein